jgi:hypothetical protein
MPCYLARSEFSRKRTGKSHFWDDKDKRRIGRSDRKELYVYGLPIEIALGIWLACRFGASILRLASFLQPHMHLRFAVTLVAVSLVAPAAFTQDQQSPEPAPSLDELVAKNIEAKGGADALRALQSLRRTGKMVVSEGQVQLAYAQVKKRPLEVRTEVTLQGMTAVEAFDGKEGWRISPFQGRKDPEKMSADDVKSLMEDAEMDGPLVDWKAKQSTVEYLGTEDVDGTPAHKLKVVRKNGDVNFVYLDPDHFLEIRILTQRIEHGAQVEVETDLGDYEKIAGVFVPFSIEAGRKGDPDKQKIIIDKAEGNVPVDDATFHFPAAPAK